MSNDRKCAFHWSRRVPATKSEGRPVALPVNDSSTYGLAPNHGCLRLRRAACLTAASVGLTVLNCCLFVSLSQTPRMRTAALLYSFRSPLSNSLLINLAICPAVCATTRSRVAHFRPPSYLDLNAPPYHVHAAELLVISVAFLWSL